jgi:UTP--glucose-1-phosphate uridylyltransferase
VLGPEIFSILEKGEKGAGGEVQLTDGMTALAKHQAFHGVRFDGKTYDCGSKLGFCARPYHDGRRDASRRAHR